MLKTAQGISKNESARSDDVDGPSFNIVDKHGAPLFCFIFPTVKERDEAARSGRSHSEGCCMGGREPILRHCGTPSH